MQKTKNNNNNKSNWMETIEIKTCSPAYYNKNAIEASRQKMTDIEDKKYVSMIVNENKESS